MAVGGIGGMILVTSNGGENWKQQSSDLGTLLTSVQFLDTNWEWVAEPNGTILAPTDGGGSPAVLRHHGDPLFRVLFGS